MNTVTLIGRLTRDPDVRTTANGTTTANFTIAVDRPVKSGDEKKADFPRITVFGKQAENCQMYIGKGSLVGITGRLQTGSYEKDGHTVFTTDVVADRVEFLDNKKKNEQNGQQGQMQQQGFPQQGQMPMQQQGLPQQGQMPMQQQGFPQQGQMPMQQQGFPQQGQPTQQQVQQQMNSDVSQY